MRTPLLQRRLDLSRFATARRLSHLPRHRWFYFPHSFDPALVNAILTECEVQSGGKVLDPFVGSGTTLLVAQENELEGTGLDFSPVSVLITQAKTSHYDFRLLNLYAEQIWSNPTSPCPSTSSLSPRLSRAFTSGELRHLLAIRNTIASFPSPYREFFTVSLLQTAQRFSRARPDGGWFRWVDKPACEWAVAEQFDRIVGSMISDVRRDPLGQRQVANVYQGDARLLDETARFDAVVTSPPYPNRHDYTRVFHIELLLVGLAESEILKLRRRSLRSHVEARALDPGPGDFSPPPLLTEVLNDWPEDGDHRVPRMLNGYFEDLSATLTRLRGALRPGATAAFVVGNVRHAGRLVPVDEILADLGSQVGLNHRNTWVIRERGNSAQQMGRLGRVPSRESVVFLSRPLATD